MFLVYGCTLSLPAVLLKFHELNTTCGIMIIAESLDTHPYLDPFD